MPSESSDPGRVTGVEEGGAGPTSVGGDRCEFGQVERLLELLERPEPDHALRGDDQTGEQRHCRESHDREMITPYAAPLRGSAGFLTLSGNLFDFGIMKTSVISEEFRGRYLSRPESPGVFEARAIVFDGSDDYHHRVNDPALAIDERCILVIGALACASGTRTLARQKIEINDDDRAVLQAEHALMQAFAGGDKSAGKPAITSTASTADPSGW